MASSSQPQRLPTGGRINRSVPLRFTFDGKSFTGYAGDTLAAALLANGIDVIGRSFKYHRPRGIVGHGAEEPNAMVQLGEGADALPALPATQIELFEGLVASSVTGWPSPRFDLAGAVGAFGRLLPPGFYYKTFMWPRKLWRHYEKLISRGAGMGRVHPEPDPGYYDKMNQHCDVLVIGAGPAGLAAARAAMASGARVIIADERSELGGSLLAETSLIDGRPAAEWLETALDELAVSNNLLLLPRTTVFGYGDHNFLTLLERRSDHLGSGGKKYAGRRLHRVRATRVVLATGAIERPLVFANNDRPGVMLTASVSHYINRFGVAPGRRMVLVTTNDHAYRTALDWHRAGRKVVAVVDTRVEAGGALVEEVERKGIKVLRGHAVIEARGRHRVNGALVAPINADGTAVAGPVRKLDCDLIASSGGWSPVIHLSSHTGVRPHWNEEIAGFVPGETGAGMSSAGAAAGTWSLAGCFAEGAAAGKAAAEQAGFSAKDFEPVTPRVNEHPETQQQALFMLPHTRRNSRAPKQFVDMQLDVTAAGIEMASAEGYRSIEHLKRYTALGLGTDQGKLGNINGMAILARSLGQTVPETGTTVFRPPYTPVAMGAIAGRDIDALFDPERYTAMHRWHEGNGAKFENVGQWKRPWYYPGPGESMHEAVNRECLAVRNRVGIMDVSTLGKIDIQGPDAAEFINRIYTNAFLKLAPGKCRYGLMLKEDGMIFDDGVTACLGENHYLMTTTTGGAAAVYAWLERWHQTEWPELDVFLASVTDHWATAAVVGPYARKVVEQVCGGIDFSQESFKFMDWRNGTAAGVPARVFRISFSGELSFEINVAAHHGRHLWETLMQAGADYGITPYGTEAMHVLRAEKGYIIAGQDTDGSRTPGDMNMEWVVGWKKAFSFIGRRSLQREDCRRDDRKQFVGLETLEPETVIPEGAQIVSDPNQEVPMDMEGHVTSSYYSATLKRSIALAMVRRGLDRMGDIVYCPLADGRVIAARITGSVFYDPKGERQNA